LLLWFLNGFCYFFVTLNRCRVFELFLRSLAILSITISSMLSVLIPLASLLRFSEFLLGFPVNCFDLKLSLNKLIWKCYCLTIWLFALFFYWFFVFSGFWASSLIVFFNKEHHMMFVYFFARFFNLISWIFSWSS